MADRTICAEYDVNESVFVFNDVCFLLCKRSGGNVGCICIDTGNRDENL